MNSVTSYPANKVMEDIRNGRKIRNYMPSIYLDLDDVIASTFQTFMSIIEQEFGKTVPYEQITEFDLKISFQLTRKECEHLFDVVHKPEQILNMEVIDGALDTLHDWSKKGFELAIMTGRPTSTYDSSLEWLSQKQIPYDSFTMVDKYGREEMDKNIAISLEELSNLKFCLAVEDSADMAEFLSTEMATHVALIDRPWNRKAVSNPNLNRYLGWEDLRNVQPM